MKRLNLLLSLLFIIPISSCSNQSRYIKDFSFNYENKILTISFKQKGYSKFGIFDKEDNHLFTIKDNHFNALSIYDEYKIVPLVNNDFKFSESVMTPNYLSSIFRFNDDVKIFNPSNDIDDINSFIHEYYEIARREEWYQKRLEILFMPGDYTGVVISNGYYTSIKGLGYYPDDVVVSKLETKNHPNTGNALINFWRSNENINVKEDSVWAISQATSLRRMHFNKSLTLSDFDLEEGDNGWSSGGFIANTRIDDIVNPGSQQQFLLRNTTFESFTHSNMNMVFEGTIGQLPEGEWLNNRTTYLENSLKIKEKPYLVFDENKGFGVVVPSLNTYQNGYYFDHTDYDFISLNDFYIAHPDFDDDVSINNALSKYQHILFTPGIYKIKDTLKVRNDESIIMGMGYATLSSEENLGTLLEVESKDNTICSLLFQNEKEINSFLHLKENNDNEETLLSDLFFRVGGQSKNNTSVETGLIIDMDNVIIDHFWVWRADHGNNIGYFKNYAGNGVIINGDNIISHAMMIEHFYKYQLIYNGENGELVFYQSETPYDLPNQTYWMRSDHTGEAAFGYPSYKIGDNVINHKGYGIGIYYVNTSGKYETCYTGLETPYNNGIDLYHISARYFGGEGGFIYTINNIKGVEDGYKNKTIEHFNNEIYQN